MKKYVITTFFLVIINLTAFAQNSEFNGKWKILKEKSSDLDYYQYMSIDFNLKGDEVTISNEYGPRRKYEETLTLKTNGQTQKVEIKNEYLMSNIYMGLTFPIGEKKEVSAKWEDKALIITEKFVVFGSQGGKGMTIKHIYKLSEDNNLLYYTIKRNTRKEGPDMRLVYKRADKNNAYFMRMSDNWEIENKLPEQACLLSIQGIANEEKPNLYFIYGPEYTFNYTEDLFNFLHNDRYFTFTYIPTLERALNIFKDKIKGYIVWDKKVRYSLIVAYTCAGLEKGIVITEDLIPLAEKYGLKKIEDYRGIFEGKSDYEINLWAIDKYWSRCSREYIIWLGGEHGNVMKPGVADYGMTKKVFFTDLSARETDTLEYNLSKKLLSEMKPLTHVMGWHSYKKDWEEEWVTLTSSYALIVDGLHTLPNMSFLTLIPATPGFKYKNKHNIEPGKKYIPENKVYVSLIQTDGLGIGAWLRPGRGTMPYAWENPISFYHMAPCMLEYYYTQATPNDYFIGALSGSGYMYPKAFPKKYLAKEIERAYDLMKKLDLNVFEIMDYAEDKTEAGKNDLPKDIVEAYSKGMPEAIGFINGYFAAHTFTQNEGRPFISYDYYLSPEKPETEAAADLKELAEINSNRPYFLLVHVREYSDVARVKSICDRLGKSFEIVPLDLFIKLAAEKPTFKERFKDSKIKK